MLLHNAPAVEGQFYVLLCIYIFIYFQAIGSKGCEINHQRVFLMKKTLLSACHLPNFITPI